MKKIFKKVLSVILMVSVLTISAFPAFANETMSVQTSNFDICAAEITETLTIEDVTYEYAYSYDKMGNRTIAIKDTVSGNVDIVKYDESSSKIYLNDTVIGSVTSVNDSGDNATIMATNDDWILITGPDSTRISWAAGIGTAAIAGAIAVAVGSIGGAAVIAAMGAGALSVIASGTPGGTVTTTVYKLNSNLIIQYKYVWSFRASTGDFYGPFTTLTNPSPYVR